ncbi:uncharacterized protein LOC117115623 [Anneissia japonica]|uniref:uncharacterized protein LOC117115623 n=1 Tax=Anneissia japonica TaxID=1529436 RepID=UPI0014259C64|nr:uncharacterized protein LOC117115623 [Anneissia japonica]
MRWHPAIIRWCIALSAKSTGGYELLRDSGFLKLPHLKTLQKYTHFALPKAGISDDFLDRMCKDFKVEIMEDHQRNVTILFDEMKVKCGLVYNVRSGQLVGYTDLGDVSNDIADFARCSNNVDPQLGTHVLVLMVRSIWGPLVTPIAYYPTEGIASRSLYPIINKAVNILELLGLRVHGLVSDGASPNRKFYSLHSTTEVCSAGVTYYTTHPADFNRRLYFFRDAPHLIKTARNNWENSNYHNKTRNLHVSLQNKNCLNC